MAYQNQKTWLVTIFGMLLKSLLNYDKTRLSTQTKLHKNYANQIYLSSIIAAVRDYSYVYLLIILNNTNVILCRTINTIHAMLIYFMYPY